MRTKPNKRCGVAEFCFRLPRAIYRITWPLGKQFEIGVALTACVGKVIGCRAAAARSIGLMPSTRSQKWVGFFPLPQAYRVSLERDLPTLSYSIDGVQITNEINAVHTELVVRCLH